MCNVTNTLKYICSQIKPAYKWQRSTLYPHNMINVYLRGLNIMNFRTKLLCMSTEYLCQTFSYFSYLSPPFLSSDVFSFSSHGLLLLLCNSFFVRCNPQQIGVYGFLNKNPNKYLQKLPAHQYCQQLGWVHYVETITTPVLQAENGGALCSAVYTISYQLYNKISSINTFSIPPCCYFFPNLSDQVVIQSFRRRNGTYLPQTYSICVSPKDVTIYTFKIHLLHTVLASISWPTLSLSSTSSLSLSHICFILRIHR